MKLITKQTLCATLPLYQFWFEISRGSKRKEREEIMYQAAHYELVASAKVVELGHKINPDFQIGCMIAMCPIYPATCKPEDMMASTVAMQRRYWLQMSTFADITQVI